MYDAFGFTGGRIKSLCDAFIEFGFVVIMPDIFEGESIESYGGCEALTVPSKAARWLQKQDPAKVTPIQEECVEWLRGRGCGGIGALGLSWGSIFTFSAAEVGMIQAGACAHPSLGSSLWYGYTGTADLAEKGGRCPMLLLPTKDESEEEYGPHGVVAQALRANGVACEVHPFRHMLHGFAARGDTADAAVQRDIGIFLEVTSAFFEKYI